MHDNIWNIIEILRDCKAPSKYEFIPYKTIECLGFVINTEYMTIRFTNAKKVVMCTYVYIIMLY